MGFPLNKTAIGGRKKAKMYNISQQLTKIFYETRLRLLQKNRCSVQKGELNNR